MFSCFIFGYDLCSLERFYNWILPIISCGLLGLVLNITLRLTKQIWATTFHFTLSFIILPIVTFVITMVIQGSIPLALGMVGALSIVRFRHPVKNAFELIMYFTLITIGIAAGANIEVAFFLTLSVILVILLLYYSKILFFKDRLNFFNSSFSEGDLSNIIEVTLNDEIFEIIYHDNLIQEIRDKKNNLYIYKFGFEKKDLAIKASNEINYKYKNKIENIIVEYNS